MLKKTPLYDRHVALGAKMSDFAGWEMPLYYGSQLEEAKIVRSDAGMFDVSHMNVVDIKGKGAHDFLSYLIANNVDKLTEQGKAVYSCMLNEKGGVIDDLIVYKYDDQDYRMVINSATHDKDLAWLNKQAENFNVEIIERSDLAMIAVQGPKAIEKAQQVFTDKQREASKDLKVFQGVEVGDWYICRTGYTGEDGYEIMMPEQDLPAFWDALIEVGVAPCGLVSRDALRLESGLSLYGSEMDETTTPLESNLAWTVALEPVDRDFIGRKALEEQLKSGVKRNIYGIILDKGAGMLRGHMQIMTDYGEGETTSGGFSPFLGVSIALARLPSQVQLGNQVFVVMRGKKVPAKVVKAGFVKRGKKIYE